MVNNQLQFCIVGCGAIAQRHAQHIATFATLKAVCDIDIKKAKKLAQQFNCTYYTSIEQMLLNEIATTAVAICTPNGLHAQHSIYALNQGFHVVCEKPMSVSSYDARAMISAALQQNKKLFVVKQNRYNPPVIAVKKLLTENGLGKILSIQLNCFWNRNNDYYKHSNWKGTKQLDGGILYTQFSHFIDLLLWFFGDVETVKAIGANSNHGTTTEFEDDIVALVQFTNGAIGTMHFTTNSYQKNMEGSLTIFGEKGTVKIGGEYLNTIEYQQIQNVEIANVIKHNAANDYGSYKGSMSNHDKVYENVKKVLLHNAIIDVDMYDGLKTVDFIQKIYSAIQD